MWCETLKWESNQDISLPLHLLELSYFPLISLGSFLYLKTKGHVFQELVNIFTVHPDWWQAVGHHFGHLRNKLEQKSVYCDSSPSWETEGLYEWSVEWPWLANDELC